MRHVLRPWSLTFPRIGKELHTSPICKGRRTITSLPLGVARPKRKANRSLDVVCSCGPSTFSGIATDSRFLQTWIHDWIRLECRLSPFAGLPKAPTILSLNLDRPSHAQNLAPKSVHEARSEAQGRFEPSSQPPMHSAGVLSFIFLTAAERSTLPSSIKAQSHHEQIRWKLKIHQKMVF